jgi:hypothetical protein
MARKRVSEKVGKRERDEREGVSPAVWTWVERLKDALGDGEVTRESLGMLYTDTAVWDPHEVSQATRAVELLMASGELPGQTARVILQGLRLTQNAHSTGILQARMPEAILVPYIGARHAVPAHLSHDDLKARYRAPDANS